jgi:glycosyltransferase involved in cell wall biosynthesis
MKILFLHQNFPGQFKYLAPALESKGHEVRAVGLKKGFISKNNPIINYRIDSGNTPGIHPLALDFESKIIRGEAVAQTLERMKNGGYTPDLVVAHPGWGESLFVKQIYPKAKQLHFCEFFYTIDGADVGFDAEFTSGSIRDHFRVGLKNAATLSALHEMNKGYSPTHWQKSLYPKPYQEKIEVIFDGIDTELIKPGPLDEHTIIARKGDADIDLKNFMGREVITFVNRNLEPYRGYHSFMRALPKIQKEMPNAITLIIGGDGVSYGVKPKNGNSWKDIFLEEVGALLDMSKIFFLGNVPYRQYLNILKLSSCHVYLTYPFVLSWSCLEAMSTGCVVIGSKTKPVEEVITDGENGLLVNFFNYDEITHSVVNVLQNPKNFLKIRAAARNLVVNRYDLKKKSIPQQIDLIERMMN